MDEVGEMYTLARRVNRGLRSSSVTVVSVYFPQFPKRQEYKNIAKNKGLEGEGRYGKGEMLTTIPTRQNPF